MAMTPTLQLGDEHYRIACGQEAGELAEYGDPATLEVSGHRYLAIIEADGDNVYSLLPDGEWMVDGLAVECDQQDVEFAVDGQGRGIDNEAGDGDEEPEPDEDEEEVEGEEDEEEGEEEPLIIEQT